MNAASPPEPSGRTIFYGWWVVAAMALILTTTGGLAFYNLSVLLQAFVAERGFPVSMASSATALFFLSSGVAGMVAGRLIDRIDARILIIASAVLSSLALACLGWIHTVWELYAFHIVFGLAYGGCGLVPSMTILARWFDAKRALALSIAMTGLSLGGALITPATAWLIARSGLDGAGPWLGAAFFIGVVPVTLFVLRASPESMGLTPDGAARPRGAPAATHRSGATWLEARQSRFFRLLSLAFVFTMSAQVGGLAHLFSMVAERNGREAAALGVACLAIASVVGRLSGGVILGRVKSRGFTLFWMLFQAAALLLLSFVWNPYLVLLCIVLFGLPVGNLLMMQPLLLAEAFGTREYGRIYAASQLITVLGVGGGPIILGLLHDAFHGYGPAYFCAAILGCCGAATLLLAGPTPSFTGSEGDAAQPSRPQT